MKLFVNTKEKKYPIYFGANSYLKIKKILNENNINPKKTMVIYDKNVPKKIISKFRTKLINNENIFIGIKFNEKINTSKALKNLVIIKKLVNNLKKNNAKFLERIDRDISSELDVKSIKSEIIFDIIRYFKTRNEFIYSYIKNDFKKVDLENIFKSFNNLNLPLSNNNCLTILKLVDLKYNSEFIDIFYKNLQTQSKDLKISIDNLDYNVCINKKNREIIDKEIFKYADIIIEDKFNEFIYAQ